MSGTATTQAAETPVPDHVSPKLVKDFDFRYAPQIAQDPWRYFADARKDEPIFWTPRNGGHWVVSGAETVDEVFRRHDLFSNGVVSIPAPPRPQSIPAGLDPPEHGKYRKILSQRLFSPKALAPIERYMDEEFGRLADAMIPRGKCEFVSAFGRPLPVALVLRIMGLPQERKDEFCEWARMMFHGDTLDEHVAGYKHAFGFLGEWVAAQRETGVDDPEADTGAFMQAMAEGRVDDRPLTQGEIHSMAMLLLGAGVDTLTSQMGHAMLHFATHPQDRQLLVDRPELIPGAVEEMLRRFAIANITRVAAQDMDYRGVTMRKGDLVLCAAAMGGLDESVYVDPLSVDLERAQPVRHTPFGAGPHICPGAYLARTMMRALMERLLPVMPGLRVAAGASLSYVSGITISLTRLPLEWDTGKGAAP